MKKTIFIMAFCLVLIPSIILAQVTWHTPNQSTIAWDATPDTRPITYKIYLATSGNKENPTLLGDTTEITYTITFPDMGGFYIVGVSSVVDFGGANESESGINWSDVNGTGTPDPFGWELIFSPSNLRLAP